MQLKDKRVVIIGGTSGIGFAIAMAAAKEGAEVIVASRSSDKIKEAEKRIGKNAQGRQLDMRHENELEKFFQQVGHFDHLQIPGSEVLSASFFKTSTMDVKKSFDSKFWGQYNAVKYAVPYLNKESSVTLFSGSISDRPRKGRLVEASINSVIEGFCRALAVELAPVIRVNAISPGVIDTPLFNHLNDHERKQLFSNIETLLPLKRIGKPEEVAHAALFLMTNSYTTGITLHVDGGYLLM